MKFYLSLLVMSFLWAYQHRQEEKETACAKKSDLFYEGLNGKVKKITQKKAHSDKIVWNIEDADWYSTNTLYYDEKGFLMKSVYRSFEKDKLNVEVVAHVTQATDRLTEWIDGNSNKGVVSTIWINDSTKRTLAYIVENGKTILNDERIFTFDKECMTSNMKMINYDASTGMVKDQQDENYRILPDSIKELRSKYKHAYIYHGLYTVIEWDEHNNPVKLILSDDNNSRSVYEYEYYQ